MQSKPVTLNYFGTHQRSYALNNARIFRNQIRFLCHSLFLPEMMNIQDVKLLDQNFQCKQIFPSSKMSRDVCTFDFHISVSAISSESNFLHKTRALAAETDESNFLQISLNALLLACVCERAHSLRICAYGGRRQMAHTPSVLMELSHVECCQPPNDCWRTYILCRSVSLTFHTPKKGLERSCELVHMQRRRVYELSLRAALLA
jgi:hypothetical protein